ncbi:hypothetical protein [Streptomyces sp. NPDC002156]
MTTAVARLPATGTNSVALPLTRAKWARTLTPATSTALRALAAVLWAGMRCVDGRTQPPL